MERDAGHATRARGALQRSGRRRLGNGRDKRAPTTVRSAVQERRRVSRRPRDRKVQGRRTPRRSSTSRFLTLLLFARCDTLECVSVALGWSVSKSQRRCSAPATLTGDDRAEGALGSRSAWPYSRSGDGGPRPVGGHDGRDCRADAHRRCADRTPLVRSLPRAQPDGSDAEEGARSRRARRVRGPA